MSLPKLRLLAALLALLALAACTQKEAKLSSLAPTSLKFTGRVGQVILDVKEVSFANTGGAALSYTVTSAPWLRVTESAGTLEPGQRATLSVRATCVDMDAGSFQGDLTLSSNASAGSQTVSVQLECTGLPLDPTRYNIEVSPLGAGFTEARLDVFEQAAALWESVITGDLANVTIQHAGNEVCGYGEPAFSGTIDDLLIYASIIFIDGPGGILAQAGPAAIRGATDDLTLAGCMQFDVDDVAALEAGGTFDEVVLHEMGHVLGIGSLWEPIGPSERDLLDYATSPPGQPCSQDGTVAFTQPPGFTGSAAVAEFAALGGSGNVPVEDGFSRGTRCSHWDEAHFSNEIMTGFLGPGNVNPISRLTVGSLEDLGYQVDFDQAEPYTIPACSPACIRLQSGLEPIREIILQPKFSVTPEGEITRLPTE